MDKTYFAIEARKHFYDNPPSEKINILAVGDSTIAFGVKPRLIAGSYSIALPSSTNINVWLDLERYLKAHSPPKCILYSTSYIKNHYQAGFLGKHISAQVYNWDELKKIYYESEASGAEPSRAMSYWWFVTKVFFLKYIDYTVNTQIKIKRMLLPFLPEVKKFDYAVNSAIREKGYLHAKRFSQDLMSERQHYLVEPFEVNSSDDFYFKKILDKTKELGIKLIYLEMPIINNESDSRIEAFHKTHMNHIQTILHSYPNSTFEALDYHPTEDQYFDMNHLNSEGAVIFTKNLAHKLPVECH